jgi:hypothetical protein
VLPRLIQLPHSGAHRPALGLRTSRRLCRHPLYVYESPDGSLVAVCRSTDLPVAPSSHTVGLRISLQLPRCCL